ncbi:substrate-binding periplasmic protein [Aestuariivirga sp.]|uniref:substrate-binding periplasmic protein n=1 Tax=Aestuariivirga sp. TaxID=2650926 RepID=UPI0039E2EC6C
MTLRSSFTRRQALVGSAMLALAFTAVGAYADTLDTIKSSGVFTVGNGVVGSKPWIWKDDAGNYTGMEWEMMNYVANKIGAKKVEVVPVDWGALIPGLTAKRWDVIFSGMTVTEERRQGAGIEFSRPYYFESDRIVVKKDSPAQKPEDLAGKTIGALVGSVEEIQARQLVAKGIGGEVKAFNDQPSVFLALNSGQVDAVVSDNTSLGGQLQITPELRTVGGIYSLSADEKWQDAQAKAPYKFGGDGVGIRKEDTELLKAINDAFDAMDADGTREAILKKYGVWDESLTRDAMMTK